MESLAAKMRLLALDDMKERRDKIFQKTRNFQQQQVSLDPFRFEHLNQEQNHQVSQSALKEQQSKEVCNLQTNSNLEFQKQQKIEFSTDHQYKTRRYWRNMFRVSDRLVTIPKNLGDYYVASNPHGTKCLMIFNRNQIELLDENSYIIFSHSNPLPHLTGTILQVSYQEQSKRLLIVDLIYWKTNSFGSIQFEYRNIWLKDNSKYSIAELSSGLKMEVQLVKFSTCTYKNLFLVYNEEPQYVRDGLLFVNKKSYYNLGHNPRCLIWKDQDTSVTFSKELDQNKSISKGLGYITKSGEVKSRDNITILKIDRKLIGQEVRFVKFIYKGIQKITYKEGEQQIEIIGLKLVGSERSNFEGFADSLSELFYKCSLRSSLVKIQDLAQQLLE